MWWGNEVVLQYMIGCESMRFLSLFPLLLVALAFQSEAPLSGWSVTYADHDPETPDVRTLAPAAALALFKGESPHPTQGVENNVAVFEADVFINAPGRWRFALRVDGGDGTLVVHDDNGLARLTQSSSGAGRTETEWLELESGPLRISVLFKRRGVARVRLRTLWEFSGSDGGSFALEPIPTRAVSVPQELLADVEQSLAARSGRVLLGRKGCANCHLPDDAVSAHLDSWPGPDLSTVGARLGGEWMRRWLANPAALLPGADMPALLDEGAAAEIADLVAFLESLTGSDEPSHAGLATEEAISARGRALYHSIGCVACHGSLESAAVVLDDPYLPDELAAEPSAVPFGDLRGKWRPTALADFLRDPMAVRPDGSMPSMDLSAAEADDLTHYLLGLWGAAPAPTESVSGTRADAASVERGAKLFGALRCAACHAGAGVDEVPPAAPLAQLRSSGCLAPYSSQKPAGARYDLLEDEAQVLAAGLDELRAARPHPAPLDRAERQLESGRCLACHAFEGRGGLPDGEHLFFQALDERTDLGDEGRLPPDLSGVGFRLTTSWLRSLLLDGQRSRPYMAARMPAFSTAAVDGLAGCLGRREGLWPDVDYPSPPPTDAAVLAGRLLMDTQDGLACESCHVHGERQPSGSPGLAMTAFAERLRYEWYKAYMPNPARFKPGTRMPSFATDGVSAETDILAGDAAAQEDAMWAYFSLGELSPPPKDATAQSSMTLTVGERPRVFRSFLHAAGSRGIAVGFPVGVHFSFDATECRLAELWRGDFINAAGSWAGRGGSELGGQGEHLWTAAAAPLIEYPGAPAPEFRGYRLDVEGVPSFLYRIGELSVEDRIVPRLGPWIGFERTLILDRAPAEFVLHAAGGGAQARGVKMTGGTFMPIQDQVGSYRMTPGFVGEDADGPLIIQLEVSF